MTRRRLIVIVGVLAAVTAGAAWWLSLASLSAGERRLVGTWRLGEDAAAGTWEFREDRRVRQIRFWPLPGTPGYATEITGRWSFRDGVIYVDHEDNLLRRAFRSACWQLGIAVAGQTAFVTEEVTAEKIIVATPNRWNEVWTRDHGG